MYANGARATAFITDEHEDGSYTVFIPTGPNPTSGGILHVAAEYVELLDVTVDEALRSIIACGSGSKQILSQSIRSQRHRIGYLRSRLVLALVLPQGILMMLDGGLRSPNQYAAQTQVRPWLTYSRPSVIGRSDSGAR